MSSEYLVLIVDEPKEFYDIDGAAAQVFMRFTEQPDDEFLNRLAAQHPMKRIYCLMGASTWHSADVTE